MMIILKQSLYIKKWKHFILLSAGDEQSRMSIPMEAAIDEIPIESSYKGLKLSFPLTVDSIHSLVTALKKKKVIHPCSNFLSLSLRISCDQMKIQKNNKQLLKGNLLFLLVI